MKTHAIEMHMLVNGTRTLTMRIRPRGDAATTLGLAVRVASTHMLPVRVVVLADTASSPRVNCAQPRS